MKKRTRFSPPAVGASALLVSLSLLVLCVFALLGLSSAQAEHRLAEASVKATAAYYAADLQAEEIFARLRCGELPDGVTRDGSTYAYTCAISEYQYLAVSVEKRLESWQILSWRVIAIEPQEIQTAPTLWDGGDNL